LLFSPSVAANNPAAPDPFISWLLAKAGMDASVYRPAALQRRMPACLRQLRATTAAEARQSLEAEPQLINKALNTLLIGVSEFFRDDAVFEHLRTAVLPELLLRRGFLRVRADGVSTGQELYSIAMLLAESGALHKCQLVGTDARADAIQAAKRGRFAAGELGGVKPEWQHRYFNKNGENWVVRDDLRKRIEWRVADLFSSDARGLWDLRLFRNVSIYLQPERLERIWHQFCLELAPGGCLVTGKAEKPPRTLPLARLASCIYRKT
jgi:chemotaxis protein methyltransferase CheR